MGGTGSAGEAADAGDSKVVRSDEGSRAGSASASRVAKTVSFGAPAAQKEFEYTVVDRAGREVCLDEAERELKLAFDFIAQRFLEQAAGLKPDELEKHGRVLLLSLAEEELERARLVN